MCKPNIVGNFIAVLGRISVLAGVYMGSIPLMIALTGISVLSRSPLQGGLNALIALCAEHTFLTKEICIDGTMYLCSSFKIKVGCCIGIALSVWLMATVGHVENTAAQTASTMNMLYFLYLWGPFIITLTLTIVLTDWMLKSFAAANPKYITMKYP